VRRCWLPRTRDVSACLFSSITSYRPIDFLQRAISVCKPLAVDVPTCWTFYTYNVSRWRCFQIYSTGLLGLSELKCSRLSIDTSYSWSHSRSVWTCEYEVPPRNTILQPLSIQTPHLLNHKRRCHLDNKLTPCSEQANGRNVHVWNTAIVSMLHWYSRQLLTIGSFSATTGVLFCLLLLVLLLLGLLFKIKIVYV